MRKVTKVTAVALAMTMCVPVTALASSTSTPPAASGSFNTSFDVYSPVLTVQVPTDLDVRVNPLAETADTGVKQFSVASNSIDIWNASIDTKANAAIPVNATVKASVSSKGEDVVTEYNSFTASTTSTKKKIYLELTEAATAATIKGTASSTPGYVSDQLDLSQYEADAEAVYQGATKKTAITQYGSLLSVDIAKPTTSDTGGSFTDASKVSVKVGSFAVTGVANTNADWKADDISVDITYNLKAINPLSLTTPKIATAPTFTAGGTADLTVVIPDVGEATVEAVAAHNDEKDAYGDYIWDEAAYTVTYAENTTTNKTDATIVIGKDDSGLNFLGGDDYKDDPQDFMVLLSDGRMVVSTLTVTK